MSQNRASTHPAAWVCCIYFSLSASMIMLTIGTVTLPIVLWTRASVHGDADAGAVQHHEDQRLSATCMKDRGWRTGSRAAGRISDGARALAVTVAPAGLHGLALSPSVWWRRIRLGNASRDKRNGVGRLIVEGLGRRHR